MASMATQLYHRLDGPNPEMPYRPSWRSYLITLLVAVAGLSAYAGAQIESREAYLRGCQSTPFLGHDAGEPVV